MSFDSNSEDSNLNNIIDLQGYPREHRQKQMAVKLKRCAFDPI